MFGENGYEVVIQNNSGNNNLIFYISKSELDEVKKLNSLLDEVKQSNSGAIESKETVSNSQDISSLEKLAELRDKGILTEDEFQKKKAQMLGI